MPSFLRTPILLAAIGGIGCSAQAVDEVADASGGMTEGLLLMERIVSRDGTTQTNVSAKFMRLSSAADSEVAERVVGTKLEMPPLGECQAIDGKPSALSSLGPIDLLEVGDVTLRTGSAVMPLAARTFPDVGDLVSGVFYTSRDAASDLPAGAVYTLESTGSPVVERFAIEAEAPPALEDVLVGGSPLADGVSLEEGAPAEVRWRAAEVGSPRGDVVLIDVSAASGASVRCAFKDEGKAVLPAAVLRARPAGQQPGVLTLALHRVRQRSFGAIGIDAGEVRFDLSVVGRATLDPAKTGLQ